MKAWVPTLSLSLAAFIFVTSEFIPVGLLPEIARGFNHTESETGLLMTGYAWIVALMSIPLTAISARYNRRPLMLVFLGIFVVAHVLSAGAWSFEILAISRSAVALSHAIFWAIAIPLGVRLAPRGRRERAISIVSTGATLGGILGVPLGTYIGEALGWRYSFGGIGLGAALVGVVLYFTLPSSPSRQSGSLKSIGPLFRRRPLLLVYAVTLITMTGHFGVFTFINPYLQTVGTVPKDGVASVLLAFGVGGLAGGLLAPTFLRRAPVATALVNLFIVIVCLGVLRGAVLHYPTTLALVLIWGLTFSAFSLVLQSLVLNLAADSEDVAMAGFSGIYNVGIGSGALIGSLCSPDHLMLTGFIGCALLLVSSTICVYLSRQISFAPTQAVGAH